MEMAARDDGPHCRKGHSRAGRRDVACRRTALVGRSGGPLSAVSRRSDLDRVVTAKPSEIYDAIAPILGLEPTCRGELIRLTHEQIAALVGTCRETTTKVLGEFADRGLLRPGRGRITLPGRDGITADNGD
jgi:CRP-like cAMP-binding protein